MTIELSPDMKRFVEKKVRAGQYESEQDLIHAALSLLEAKDEIDAEDLADLRREVDIGIQQAERGEWSDFTAKDIIKEGLALRARLSSVRP